MRYNQHKRRPYFRKRPSLHKEIRDLNQKFDRLLEVLSKGHVPLAEKRADQPQPQQEDVSEAKPIQKEIEYEVINVSPAITINGRVYSGPCKVQKDIAGQLRAIIAGYQLVKEKETQFVDHGVRDLGEIGE